MKARTIEATRTMSREFSDEQVGQIYASLKKEVYTSMDEATELIAATSHTDWKQLSEGFEIIQYADFAMARFYIEYCIIYPTLLRSE